MTVFLGSNDNFFTSLPCSEVTFLVLSLTVQRDSKRSIADQVRTIQEKAHLKVCLLGSPDLAKKSAPSVNDGCRHFLPTRTS